MITGTQFSVVIGNELDCDNELGVDRLAVTMDNDWLTEDMAEDVIKHLAEKFNMPILEYIEKLEEK